MTRDVWRSTIAATVAAFAFFAPAATFADEGGVPFWLSGQFGSLVATPSTPGWQAAAIYYHSSVSAGRGAVFPRGGRIEAGLNAKPDLLFLNSTYVFATPLLGGQASIGLTGAFGNMGASISGTVTGPLGNTVTGSRNESVFGVADLYPMFQIKWNQGVNNFMTYVTGDIPVGTYDVNSIANIGIGHGAIDAGGGYTYFDPKSGYEFSVATGFTYNFRNTDSDYQNGVNWHVDWGASKFLTKQLLVGAVGYYYQQITADTGSGAVLGAFKSRIAGVGPQIGYIIPMGETQGYINLKSYYEFEHQNRPQGWNVWLTFALSPAAEPPQSSPPPRVRK
ncbi:SphA family protein [Tardiphaga sp. 841_E9_N1_2]|jgi:hypothetical protein|uniref:SphA family protein n=1 Tax=Tardiphaga sp. 841_E9_N1_2 TaxID=3240762 RepID=UPI003F2468B2